MQFSELQARVSRDIVNEERIDVQWPEVRRMTSVVGGVKFGRAAKVMLQLLAVPHGSAKCEYFQHS